MESKTVKKPKDKPEHKGSFYYWTHPDSGLLHYSNDKIKPMTKREQQSALKTQQKTIKEAEIASFKQRARFQALETAEGLNPNKSYAVERQPKAVLYDITKEAEKIYQWLIKILK